MVSSRWSIHLFVCVAIASGGCTGPVPWLSRRSHEGPPDGWEREYRAEYLARNSAEPTFNAREFRRPSSEQRGGIQPPNVTDAGSFSSTDSFHSAEQVRLDTQLEQLGRIDPETRRELEILIAESPEARAYAMQLLPGYLQSVTQRSPQTSDPRAQVASLLPLVEVQPTTRSDLRASYAEDYSPNDARTQRELERIAAITASTAMAPSLRARPVLGVSDNSLSRHIAAIEPPPSNPYAQPDRQASYGTGYDPSRPYREETPSLRPSDPSSTPVASTGDIERDVTRVSHEGSTGSASGNVSSDASPTSASDSTSLKSWREHLASTIRVYELELSDELESKSESDDHVADHARLRLLYLLADNQDCVRDIPDASPADQEFWKDELHGLRTLLDTEGNPDSRYRSGVAARRLQSALDRLSQMSKLTVEHTTFVTRVDSWGVYTPFPSTDFRPGQRVMIYAEIKNFVSHETEKGHETKLRGRYEIFARHGGQTMIEHDFSVVNETCRNQRHDYFVRYEFDLATNLNPGQYTLRLTINDLHGASVAQEDVDFSILAGK